MDNLNLTQTMSAPIDFSNVYKHFELRDILEKTKTSQSEEPVQLAQSTEQLTVEQMDDMIRTLPYMNDNIRANIKLGIEIYKQLNNFDRNYIHEVINEKSKNSK
jgi:hypothetical protein